MPEKLTLTTCAWGDFHLRAMFDFMIPTLLADDNLPALSRSLGKDRLRYLFLSDEHGAQQIRAHPLVAQMRDLAGVQITAATSDQPDGKLHFNCHVEWFHQQEVQCKALQSVLIFVPPDVLWSNNAVGNIGLKLMAADATVGGISVPHIRVCEETIRNGSNCRVPIGDAMSIEPGKLVRLGVEHAHPLLAAATVGARHCRIAHEAYWRVPGEGLLLRQVARELTAFDPCRVKLSQIFYPASGTPSGLIHVVTDSDEAVFLSLHPRDRDMSYILVDHKLGPADLAYQALHPQNDVPLVPFFSAQSIRLHYGPTMTNWLWEGIEREADVFMRDMLRIYRTFKRTNNRTSEHAGHPATYYDRIRSEIVSDFDRLSSLKLGDDTRTINAFTEPVPAVLMTPGFERVGPAGGV